MKKRKSLMCNSQDIIQYVTSYGTLHIVKHTQAKTGVSMYTLCLDQYPLLTFAELFPIVCLCDTYSEEIASIFEDIVSVFLDNFESEELHNA